MFDKKTCCFSAKAPQLRFSGPFSLQPKQLQPEQPDKMMDRERNNIELDILITGGTLITMSENMEIIEDPAVGIKDGKILFVEKSQAQISEYRAKEILDASESIVMPGLINTHTHSPMVCFRGLADDLPLMEWLNDHIFPAELKYVNEDMVYNGSLLAIAEMILSGTTTFCDTYFYESSVAQAAVNSGMRAVSARGFMDSPTPGNPDPFRHTEIAGQFIERWADATPLISPALICHTPLTCSAETLRNIKNIARNSKLPFIIHLSETKDEVKIIEERYGLTPVSYLHSLDVLDNLTVAVHCVWLSRKDIEILADHDVKVSHNPESNMKLGSGVAPIPKLLEKGVTVGLGTDGCASNNDLDMFMEMDTAVRIHKVAALDPTVMDAKTVLKMATIGGAKVLGLEDRIGSIEAGKCADIIILDMKKPHLTPLYNCYSQIVYSAEGHDVSTAIIDGKIVMKEKHLLCMDLCDIMERVRKIADVISDSR
jgi:Cytosine deaminase and related metal-dependent hydrolases